MADPTFMTSGPIDLILGSQIYATILKEGVKKNKLLCAQNTELGWILTGTTPTNRNSSERKAISMITMAEIDEQLRAFWEMDQTKKSNKKIIHHCEKHFAETHTRTQDGRYEVKLPFEDDTSKLGDSRKQAMARLVHLENKFATN
ncbi:uncharacterized protein LOC129808527 [Phlebotomus papatasi]|uniref:uncharacterized protein LOC129808527 n=1 Tax=Phlebotomus papatasi TaxID=29031 RepID=UPI0024846B5B|nr:uncharacterized protein LOC129808527 [Phlebotomus papatasi]